MTREEIESQAERTIEEIKRNIKGSRRGTSGRVFANCIDRVLSSGASQTTALGVASFTAFSRREDYVSLQTPSEPIPSIPGVDKEVGAIIRYVQHEYGNENLEVHISPSLYLTSGVGGIFTVSQSYDREKRIPPHRQTTTYVYSSRRGQFDALTFERSLQQTYQRGRVERIVGITTDFPFVEPEDRVRLTIITPVQSSGFFRKPNRP